MRYLILLFSLIGLSAHAQSKLDGIRNQPKVVITLNQLRVYEIPKDLGRLNYAEDLTIQMALPEGVWATHPPLIWYETRPLVPPYRHLPESIGNLKNLKELKASNLELGSLPESITQLQKLEVLDVSLNKLDISDELPKIAQLSSLKRLIIMGNHYDEKEIIQFKMDHPRIIVQYNSEGL